MVFSWPHGFKSSSIYTCKSSLLTKTIATSHEKQYVWLLLVHSDQARRKTTEKSIRSHTKWNTLSVLSKPRPHHSCTPAPPHWLPAPWCTMGEQGSFGFSHSASVINLSHYLPAECMLTQGKQYQHPPLSQTLTQGKNRLENVKREND